MPRHAGIEPAMQVVRDAPPAPSPPQAPPQAVPSPVANNQVAQEILRASAVAPSANTRRRRIGWLGGIAAVLALVLGGVFSGLLGDPAQLLAGGASPPLATPPPGVAGESAPAPVDATAATTAVADASSASAPVSAPASVAPAVAPVVVPPVAAVAPVRAPAGAVRSAATVPPASKSTPRAATPPNPIRPQTGPQTAKGRAPVPTAPVLADASAPGADTALRAGGLSKSAIVASTRTPGPLEQGYAALLEGRFDAAAQAYGQALRANPQERDALLGMAYISQQKGRRGEAQAYYQEVLRQEPGNAIAVAGLQSLEPGTQSRALNAVVGGPDAGQADSAAAMAANGSALVREGHLADAAQAFARAQSLEPANPLHAYNHAVAQDRMGRHAMALPLYEAVLQLDAAAPPVLRGYQPEAVRTRVAQLRAAMAPNPAPTP
ncbi:MAG: tetratricopeptide repeat protein [Burkholderiales bacterium]|nr:tetratricopeptide repeat protein [Burkholderiales bacterium]